MRRATASIGAFRRPLLLIVHPSAERNRLTCSVPTGTPRMKMVSVLALDSGPRCCAAASPATAATHAAATQAATNPRVQWSQRMPQHSIGYQAARAHAAFVVRANRGRIIVSGGDRRAYLHGLLTNDIEALDAGRGCYAAYLTAQGRMIADLWVYELGDVILLSMIGDV